MKKTVSYAVLALLLVAAMGFVVVGDLQQDKKEDGKAYLGVYLGEITEKIAEKYELEMTEGALVSMVTPGGAASKAGIMHHDIIVAIDGSPVKDVDALKEMISQYKPGDVIEVTVVRNGRRQTLNVELGEYKEMKAWTVRPNVAALGKVKPRIHISGDKEGLYNIYIGSRYHLGISYQELNKGLGEYFDRPDGNGLLITDVQEDSAAAKAGLKAGDVIVAVDGNSIVDGKDLMNALRAKDDEDKEAETRTFQIEIIRRGQTMNITLEAEKGHGFEYNYFINGERHKLNSEKLRERLEHFRDHSAPEIVDSVIMAMPDMEFLGEDIEFMMPDLEMMIPDLEMMMPDLEMMMPDLELMVPDLDIFVPDIELMMPDFEMMIPPFEGFLDLKDFDLDEISLELRPDGSVIFNGEKFDSVKKFREHMKTKSPETKTKPDTTKVI